MGSIYGLYDTEGNLRYIGKANDPAKRLDGHMREAKRRDYPVYRWINKHGRPELRILAENCSDWRIEERRLIAEARARGEKLLNVADGGDEPFCPPEVRASNAKKLSAHPNTQKQRRINGQRSKEYGYLANLKSDPLLALAHRAKREFPSIIKLQMRIGDLDGVDRMRARMRELHSNFPELFPKWANI